MPNIKNYFQQIMEINGDQSVIIDRDENSLIDRCVVYLFLLFISIRSISRIQILYSKK